MHKLNVSSRSKLQVLWYKSASRTVLNNSLPLHVCVCYTFFYCWNSAVGVKRQCDEQMWSLCATAGLFEDAGPEVTLLKQLCKVFFLILDQQWRYYCSLEIMLTTVRSKEMNINDLMTPVFCFLSPVKCSTGRLCPCYIYVYLFWTEKCVLCVAVFLTLWSLCTICQTHILTELFWQFILLLWW